MEEEEEEDILKNNNFIQKVEHFGEKFQFYIGNKIDNWQFISWYLKTPILCWNWWRTALCLINWTNKSGKKKH